MSIIVSVKINDGIVMAADSATSFANGQTYEHANKIVNLVKGVPIGVMTCGVGGIGRASTATLLKDLRQRLSGEDGNYPNWGIDPKKYEMQAINAMVHQFFAEKVQEADQKAFFMLRVCGYSSGKMLPEVWQVAFKDDGGSFEPECVQKEESFGTLWNGEQEALNRLILGLPQVTDAAAGALGVTIDQLEAARGQLTPHVYAPLIMTAAPIQDAIDLARYLVETTKGFVRFSIDRPKTVGGPIEIAAITKHEGFKWVQRKHFYSAEINP